MEEGNPRRHRRGPALLLPCSWRRSSTRPSASKLGERPSAEERQPKVMHGICKNGAKQNRAAENHHASERLNPILRQSAASLPCAGHAAAAKTLLVLWGQRGENLSKRSVLYMQFL